MSADAIQRVKKAAGEISDRNFTDGEVGEAIRKFFDPNGPPPNLTQKQIDDVVRYLLPEEPN
jgi:hypothetical protein